MDDKAPEQAAETAELQPVSIKPLSTKLPFWDRHRLSILLAATVVISIIMTSVSVVIYNVSGAAQLDLSRPGYRAVSSQVTNTDGIDTYSSSGPVNKQSIEEFMKLYDSQASKAKAVDAFNGDPLNPDVLEFGTNTDSE